MNLKNRHKRGGFFVPHYNPPMRWILNTPSLLPGIVGLFFVRLLLEVWAVSTHTAVSTWIPLSLSIIIICIVFGLSRYKKREESQRRYYLRWPTILLFIYLLFPRISPSVAVFNFGLVLLLHGVLYFEESGWGKRPFFQNPRLLASVSALIFLILYIVTIAPDVLPADNGEFQWVPTVGGVLHPPGFPLYTLLANLATRLVWKASPALAISLFAALSSSLTLYFVYRTIFDLTRNGWAALTAVIALGTATTFWAQATTANVRSLTGLFAAIALCYLGQLRDANGGSFDKRLITAVLCTSLGIAHHPSLIFFGLIFVFYVLWLDKKVLYSGKRVGWLLLATLPGLLPFLYLPLRAESGAPGAKASLASWSGFWNHALARGFSGDFFFFIQPSLLFERFRVMGNVLRFQFSPWLLLGMFIGGVALIRFNKKIAFLLLGSFLLHTLMTATYRAPQTVEYMLPAYLPAAICLGIGINQLGQIRSRLFATYLVPLFVSGLFLLSIGQGVSGWSTFRFLHHSTDTQLYTTQLLTAAEPNAIILADWHWYTPLRYKQEVDGLRPDVEIRFVSPSGDSYGETWANRISTELANGRSVIATHFDPDAYQSLPTSQPVGEAFQFSNKPITDLPKSMTATNLSLDDVTILGVDLGVETAVIGELFTITVAWDALANEQPRNLFVHAVGFDGQLYAQDDQTIVSPENGMVISQFRLTLRPGSQPGSFALMVGHGEQREQIGSINAVPALFSAVTQHAVFYPVQGAEKRLVGFDWDQTLPNRSRLYTHWQTPTGYFSLVTDDAAISQMVWPTMIGAWGVAVSNWQPTLPQQPSHYIPFGRHIVWLGGQLLMDERPLSANQTHVSRLQFASSQPILRDTAVSVRLIGFEEDQFRWAWWDLADSIPAMGAIPTLKWVADSRVTSPHFLTVPENATSGQTIGTTLRLYDAFTNQALPILDERITANFQWVPLSQSIIE